MSDTKRNLVVSVILLALAIGYLIWARSYPPEKAEVPTLVAWITLVLAAVDVLAHTDTAAGRRVAALLSGRAHLEAVGNLAITAEEWLAAAWMAVSLAAILVGGFLLGLFIYMVGYMIIHGKLAWRLSLCLALGTTFTCWLVFDELLNVGLYRGLFLEG
jgi:hypothetical protein